MPPSLLSCFSAVSMSWFTFAIAGILYCGPLTCLLLATPLPLDFHCKSVVSVSVILESYLVELDTDSIHRTQMQWPATPTPLTHRQAPPLSGLFLSLSLIFFEVSSLSALGLMQRSNACRLMMPY